MLPVLKEGRGQQTDVLAGGRYLGGASRWQCLGVPIWGATSFFRRCWARGVPSAPCSVAGRRASATAPRPLRPRGNRLHPRLTMEICICYGVVPLLADLHPGPAPRCDVLCCAVLCSGVSWRPRSPAQDMRKALEACIGRMLEIRHWMVGWGFRRAVKREGVGGGLGGPLWGGGRGGSTCRGHRPAVTPGSSGRGTLQGWHDGA